MFDVFLMQEYSENMNCNHSYPSYRGVDKLAPHMLHRVEAWLHDNPEIFITETWRSQERQDCLRSVGASRIERSMHQDGLAVDIAFYGDSLYPPIMVYDDEQRKNIVNPVWRKVADSALFYDIDWGYDLWAHTGFVDAVHFQLSPDHEEWNGFDCDDSLESTVSLLDDMVAGWEKMRPLIADAKEIIKQYGTR